MLNHLPNIWEGDGGFYFLTEIKNLGGSEEPLGVKDREVTEILCLQTGHQS